MNAAYDKIASFTSNTPLSRSTLRRDRRLHLLSTVWNTLSRATREWGYGLGIYEYRLKGRHPVQLLGSPDDPAPGSATLGAAIFGGDMLHKGEQHKLDETFWTTLESKSPAFQKYAHSFHWLQDLAQTSDQKKAQDAAETITDWWLKTGDTWDREIWQADIMARRMINWFSHAPLILSSLDLVYRSKVLLALARQARHLARTHKDAPAGLPSVYTGAALTLAGLLLPGGTHWLTKGQRFLERTVKSFILPDGGPASRNPADAIRAMQLLILVRGGYVDTDNDLPPWVQITLDRLAPYVRACRHGDGSFAQFGGVSAEGSFGTDAILAASEAQGKPTENCLHSGLQRMTAGSHLLLVDTGTPPASPYMKTATASTGAFEFSVGQDRLIVSMGPAETGTGIPGLEDMVRTTAAHSALIIADTNSSRVLEHGKLGAGVTETLTIRESFDDGTRLKVTHDGYLRRFGVKHERTLKLKTDGRLYGEDRLFGSKSKKLEGEQICLRFHLHPSVEATKAPDGRITLSMKSGKTWIFEVESQSNANVANLTVDIEDSLYMKRPAKPEATRQITVSATARHDKTPIITWHLSEMQV